MAAAKRRRSAASTARRHARWAARGVAAADRATDALSARNGANQLAKASRRANRRRAG